MSPPAMVVSESAHRLAIRLAMKGRCVVYVCPNEFERVWARRDVIDRLPKRRFWVWLIFWKYSSHLVEHPSGGHIHFMGPKHDGALLGHVIDLEVHV